jgi:hypothetical protein
MKMNKTHYLIVIEDGFNKELKVYPFTIDKDKFDTSSAEFEEFIENNFDISNGDTWVVSEREVRISLQPLKEFSDDYVRRFLEEI